MSYIYLFNVEKVLGVKGDGCAGNGHILIQGATVAHVRFHRESYRFGLETGEQNEEGRRRGTIFPMETCHRMNDGSRQQGNHFPERALLLGFIVAGHIQRAAEMTPGVTHSSQPSHFLSAVLPSILNKEPSQKDRGEMHRGGAGSSVLHSYKLFIYFSLPQTLSQLWDTGHVSWGEGSSRKTALFEILAAQEQGTEFRFPVSVTKDM